MQPHYLLLYCASQHSNQLLIIKFPLILGKPLGMTSVIYALQSMSFTATKSFLCKSCKQDIIVPTNINYVYRY